jgi:NAD-dependent dihydropyrimidine dehydrogenase PreA subunit
MPILINENTCLDGCTICDFFCPGDIIYREARNEPPIVKYQNECWYCGACVIHCPVDAVSIVFPDEMLNCKTEVMSLMGLTLEEAGQKESLSGSLPAKERE